MSAVLQFSFNFYSLECGKCGILFAISNDKYTRCKENGEDFYCPNGHSLIFIESENQKLQRQLDQEKKRREWAEAQRDGTKREIQHERKRSTALRAWNTRIKNRISNGVCPCCTRSFQNLKLHMKLKHPDFNKDHEK